ncbi:MAG: MFS transporter [Alphaproteobacteria bacterium]|nr:MFS transporter [Alphaproteobacteria bacterium]
MVRPSLPPAFRRLAWSNLAAQAAEQIALAAAPLTAVLALGAGVAETGALAAAQTLPFLLLALPIGVLADRIARRRLMAAAECLRAAALLAVPVVGALGLLSVPLLGLLGFLAAAGTVAYSVAAPSLVPALVPHRDLAAANGRLELARSLAFAAGPAIGGVLVGWTGAPAAFAAAAVLSLWAALLLSRIAEPPRAAAAARHPLRELQEGAVFVLRHPLLRPILATAVGWNLSWFVLQAAWIPYAVEVVGLSAAGIGTTLGAYGIGMVAGALSAPAVARRLRIGRMIALGPLVSVAAGAAMAASIRWPHPALPAAAFFLFGAGPILWTIGQTTLRQSVTPPDLLGRASALMTMATFGARPLGAAVGAALGSLAGPAACIALAAVGFVVQAATIALSAVPRADAPPEAAAPAPAGTA